MTTLLVLTAGQSDVQIVVEGVRRELSRDRCAALHDELERRGYALVEAPVRKERSIETFADGELNVCTPKLDAVLREVLPDAALVLETRRESSAAPSDPLFVGAVLEARLKAKGVQTVRRHAYLRDRERLEDPEEPHDAVIRREVVHRLDGAVRDAIVAVMPSRIVVAATGGFPVVTNLVEEIVRLHASVPVEALEVADGTRASPPAADRAIARLSNPEPLVSFQARRRALELIERGNLLGAWAVVEPLHTDEVERRWTQVVEWLARFASSMPVPATCNIDVMTHQCMAARTALRVELALRAGDIPRAVHGTVAFFESALWDHLGLRLTRNQDPNKCRLFSSDSVPDNTLVRQGDGTSEDRGRPFEVAEEVDGVRWYKVFDDDVCGVRIAKRYLQRDALVTLGQAVSKVRELRNDVAHNEPTPETMNGARDKMVEAGLWPHHGSQFLAQPLVQGALRELGEEQPHRLCIDLISTVRSRLMEVPVTGRPPQ